MEPERGAFPSPQPLRHLNLEESNWTVPSRLLYVSHFLSTWNSRGFEFGAVLFLSSICPGTLLPMSIYALVRAASAVLFSHRTGRYIDTTNRLSVVRVSIIGQRIAVAFSCMCFLFLLVDTGNRLSLLHKVVFVVLVVLACVEKLCSVMNTVAIERDWVVVIADGDPDSLQELNAQMRRIDLLCKLVAPLVIALIDGISTKIALLTTLGLNMCSVAAEYPFIAKVYRRIPALARPNAGQGTEHLEESGALPADSFSQSSESQQRTAFAAFRVYVSSAAFLPSLALSMLYLTVLSFSGQMITFLLAIPHPKMTSTTIGVLRTFSTIFEISATWIAPMVMSAIGPVRGGIWCLSWQVLCLTAGVGMLWTPSAGHSTNSILIFICAVILSRVGLWSFDLVAQLLIQNSIDSAHRGSFSSAEASLQNFCDLCTFAMTIVFSRPEQFKYPALASLLCTFCAAALYAKFVRDRRGHLIHIPSCLKHVAGSSYEMISARDDG